MKKGLKVGLSRSFLSSNRKKITVNDIKTISRNTVQITIEFTSAIFDFYEGQNKAKCQRKCPYNGNEGQNKVKRQRKCPS